MNLDVAENKAALQRKTFSHVLRVPYAHCTVGNHVYYARYLDILEAARGEFFRELGFSCLVLQEAGVIFQVSECSVKYLKAARYDDELRVVIGVGELKKVRLHLDYEIYRREERLLCGSTLMVCMGLDERPMRIPDELLAALSPYAGVAAA